MIDNSHKFTLLVASAMRGAKWFTFSWANSLWVQPGARRQDLKHRLNLRRMFRLDLRLVRAVVEPVMAAATAAALCVAAVGLFAYALYKIIAGVSDLEYKGSDAEGIAQRLDWLGAFHRSSANP